AGGWVLTPDRPDEPLWVAAGAGMSWADVSRDGRWVCLSVHAGYGKVYDGRTGQQVWEDASLTLGPHCRFTADARWLVGDWGACRVGDWTKTVVLDPSRTGSSTTCRPTRGWP